MAKKGLSFKCSASKVGMETVRVWVMKCIVAGAVKRLKHFFYPFPFISQEKPRSIFQTNLRKRR